MGATKDLIGVPAPFQIEAKPRVCGVCGLPKMDGRAPQATKCLDCAGGRRDLGDARRRSYGTKVARLPVAR